MVRNIHMYGKRTKTFLSNIKHRVIQNTVQTTAGTSMTSRTVITLA